MKESRRRLYVILYLIFVSILFIAALVYLAYHAQTIEGMALRPGVIALIGVLTILLVLLLAAPVYVLIRGMGFSGSFWNLYRIQTTSLATSLLTPFRLGIPMKVWLYKKYFGVPYANGAGIVSLEIFVPFTLMGTVGASGIIIYLDPRYFLIPVLIVLLALALSLVLLRFEPMTIVRYFKLDPSRKLIKRFISGARRFQIGIRSTSRSAIFIVYFMIVVRHLLAALRLWGICLLFNAQVSFVDCIFILALSQTIGTLSILPMGMGVIEASLIFLLSLVGINSATSLSISVMQRLLTSGVVLVLGAISAPKLGLNLLRMSQLPQDFTNGSNGSINSVTPLVSEGCTQDRHAPA